MPPAATWQILRPRATDGQIAEVVRSLEVPAERGLTVSELTAKLETGGLEALLAADEDALDPDARQGGGDGNAGDAAAVKVASLRFRKAEPYEGAV